jgi:hypothetical protein
MYYSPVFEKKVDDLSQASWYLMDRKINTEGSFEKEIWQLIKINTVKHLQNMLL